MHLLKLVLHFIILICPGNGNPFKIVESRYGKPTRILVRNIQKDHIQRAKLECDITFLQKCIDHNLQPRCSWFKLAPPPVRTSHLRSRWRKELLLSEIKFKRKRTARLKNNCNSATRRSRSTVSWLVFTRVMCLIQSDANKAIALKQESHTKKLLSLGYSDTRHPPASKVIFNSSHLYVYNIL